MCVQSISEHKAVDHAMFFLRQSSSQCDSRSLFCGAAFDGKRYCAGLKTHSRYMHVQLVGMTGESVFFLM